MKKKALIIGGSGGLSGRLATMAQKEYDVWVLTRGKRPVPDGVHPLTANRNDPAAFLHTLLEEHALMHAEEQHCDSASARWDVVFDCICMNEAHAEQDLEVLPEFTDRLVVISTDSVYDPAHKQTPQTEEGIFIEETGSPEECSYAGNKRRMEHVFLDSFEKPSSTLRTTIFRPGHIYGPGFLLGCFPEHSRQESLPELIARGEPLHLVGGGIYLTQPIFVDDLAQAMLDCVDCPDTFNQVFCIGGPKAVENRRYYEIIGELLGTLVRIEEIPLSGYVEAHPEYAGHLCHRIYDLNKLKKAGVPLPSTTLEEGLRMHLQSLQ
ncbi:MAG: NAD-dependent epimerase/dehydratase family protein [Lachnospiraceae bacterium]|nr:NAD-dependent epimerase/dehydratase family protein [Lachnospiraceae bacterium]